MPQQKSTSFSAAKVENFGVVMAEMVEERLRMEKEIKRLQHHVSVLSKRNHGLMKEGKRRAVSSIASDTSLRDLESEVEESDGEEEEMKEKMRLTVVGTEYQLIEVAHKVSEMGRVMERKWLENEEVAVLGGRVEAESVASFEEAEVAKPVVKLPRFERVKGISKNITCI